MGDGDEEVETMELGRIMGPLREKAEGTGGVPVVRDANYILAHTSEITHIPNGRQYTADMKMLEAKQPAPLRCV